MEDLKRKIMSQNKTHFPSFWALIFLTATLTILGASSEDGDTICSVKEPTSSQLCIAVKFPWKDQPVFFCTDYGKINYNPQCVDPTETHHCPDDGRNDSLKIATPWDCCPLISSPNQCGNAQCPPPPYNRNCKEIKILGACCPTYFCDSGEPENCKSRRLHRECVRPPANKVNCTAFRDPFGCCNKYQCAGEGKSGVCPRHDPRRPPANPLPTKSPKEERGIIRRTYDGFVSEAKKTVHKVTTSVKDTLETHGGSVGRKVAQYIPTPFKPDGPPPPPGPPGSPVVRRCTGDHTCPGSMKCCQRLYSWDYTISGRTIRHQRINGVKRTTTHKWKADYYRTQRNSLEEEAVDGICVEPLPPGTILIKPEPFTGQSGRDFNDLIDTSTIHEGTQENSHLSSTSPVEAYTTRIPESTRIPKSTKIPESTTMPESTTIPESTSVIQGEKEQFNGASTTQRPVSPPEIPRTSGIPEEAMTPGIPPTTSPTSLPVTITNNVNIHPNDLDGMEEEEDDDERNTIVQE